MNQELPPGQAADEIHDLTEIVANSLAEGEAPEAVAQKLIDSGWDPDQAKGYVASIHRQIFETPKSGGQSESQGWLIWIGVIVGINFLSWLFNWGFWIY